MPNNKKVKKVKEPTQTEINDELMRKYGEYMGIDPHDTTVKEFTRDEQIARYAKNIMFWKNEMASIDLNSASNTAKIKQLIVSDAYTQAYIAIEQFPKKMQKAIYDAQKNIK